MSDSIEKRSPQERLIIAKALLDGVIQDLPSTQPEQKVVGRWITLERGEHGYSAGDFKCSVCGGPNKCYSLTKYCANCGAKMNTK